MKILAALVCGGLILFLIGPMRIVWLAESILHTLTGA